MWFFLEYVSATLQKIDYKSAWIIAGAIFGFFIQLIIVVFLDARLNRNERK
jgi:hypothetical protein